MNRPARSDSVLFLVLALAAYAAGVFLRYQFIFVDNRPTDPANIFGDIEWYVFESQRIFTAMDSPTLYDTLFPPGTAIYIAALRALDPSSALLVISQWVLACAVPLLLSYLALRLFGRTNAVFTLAFTSLYFPLWEYFGYLFSEGPFLFTMFLSFLLIVLSLQAESAIVALAWGLLGGLFLGASATFKSVALLSAGFAFLALLYYRFSRTFRIWPTVVAALAGVVIVLTPISIRSTRLNEGKFLLIANDASRTFLLGHQGRAGLTWWVDSKRDFHMNFINPSTIHHDYGEVKTYPFGVYENGPNYAAGWQWTKENPLDALLLSIEHVFDLFAVPPYPGYFRPYSRWVGFFNSVFLALVFLPALFHLIYSRRRMFAADPAYMGDTMMAAATASIFVIAFFFVGEGRYRICYDGFMILLASRAFINIEPTASRREEG